jgi:hypothetical protein
VEAPEHTQQHSLKTTSVVEESAAIKSTSRSNPSSTESINSPVKKPANSRRCVESQLEKTPSIDMFRAKSVAAQPLQQKYHVSTALLLGYGSTGNVVQATPTETANAPPDMQETHPDGVFQSDKLLNEIELEVIWLGEESMYCLVCSEFQFDFIYEYASPTLKVELRKLSRDDQSETEKLKQIVRMESWRVSRHFEFTRKDIRMNYF